MESMLDRQAKTEAHFERMRLMNAQIVQTLTETSAQIKNVARILEETIVENRQAHLRWEEAHRANEEAHRRFDELHQQNEERFTVIRQMMDEWIRERGKNKNSE